MSEDIKFEIKNTEIQEIIQLSKLQGGSKYRQDEIYKKLDQVVARGPVKDNAEAPGRVDISAKDIECPHCGAIVRFEYGWVTRVCQNCGAGIFRRL